MDNVKGLFDFIKKSPTAFQTVATVADMLEKEGYTRLYEGKKWTLTDGGKYYVVRSGSALIAFRTVKHANGFMISAAHTDSPTFRVKLSGEKGGAYTRLDVEKYGGMIYYSWLDRPLSIAGRVVTSGANGVECHLVNLDTDLCSIPSLAIHLNRGVNDGASFNPAVDLLPLYATSGGNILDDVAEAVGTTPDEILSHDLFLYNRDEGKTFGKNGEFIICPRLDDLESVYASLRGFLAADKCKSVPVYAIFDNEEVGSETKQGAASTFLYDTLTRIAGDDYMPMLASSMMLSIDNAHALHPNRPEMSDRENAPVLGGGIVVKFNANQRYATDAVSHALFLEICRRAAVPTQRYYNRADLPGGSTLGSISNTCVSVPTIDIGFPQLAMHSANETAAVADLEPMIKAVTAFFSTSISENKNGYNI
ncbi:MAG: M18 family aminopeptidase [Clostridia bacterium]|nr:M18 family aminopeptidase [Clostridia bacterium]